MELSQDSVATDEVCASGAATATAAASSTSRFPESSASQISETRLDHRREPRFPLTGSVRVGWVGGDHQMRYVRARGIDISEEGLGVQTSERLLPGALVHVDLCGCGISAVGRVRYCVPDGSAYHAGFEVVSSFPSDPASIASE
jgi:hypothetical protein